MTKEIKKDIVGNEIKVGLKVAYRHYGRLYVGYVRKINSKTAGIAPSMDYKYSNANVSFDNVVIPANQEQEEWKKKAEELQAFINDSLDNVLKGLKAND